MRRTMVRDPRVCRLLIGLILTLSTSCLRDTVSPDPQSATPRAGLAPLYDRFTAQRVPGRYIVAFKREVVQSAVVTNALAQQHGISPIYRWNRGVLRGFVAQLSLPVVELLRRHPNVDYIEQDAWGSGQQASTTSWGIDRIDQRLWGANRDYAYNYVGTGEGVRIYFVDTGILYSHNEFGGRAHPFYDFQNGTGADCHGHGTGGAALAGGTSFGAAKAVSLYSVRVLQCDNRGSNADVINGLKTVELTGTRPAVVNLAYQSDVVSEALDQAVRDLVSAGFPVVIGAGNRGANACDFSPSRVSTAIVVGGTDSNDTRFRRPSLGLFSNWGPCISLFAPGSDVTTANWTANNAQQIATGTSFSTAFVSGIVAMYLQGHPFAAPADVKEIVQRAATDNVVTDPNGAPNLLAYSRIGDEPYTVYLFGPGGQGNEWRMKPNQTCVFSIQVYRSDGRLLNNYGLDITWGTSPEEVTWWDEPGGSITIAFGSQPVSITVNAEDDIGRGHNAGEIIVQPLGDFCFS